MPLQLDFSPIITVLVIPVILVVAQIFGNKQSVRTSIIYALIGMIIGSILACVMLQIQISGMNAHYTFIGATETALTNIQGNIQATATALEATLLPFKIETAVAATMQAAPP